MAIPQYNDTKNMYFLSISIRMLNSTNITYTQPRLPFLILFLKLCKMCIIICECMTSIFHTCGLYRLIVRSLGLSEYVMCKEM